MFTFEKALRKSVKNVNSGIEISTYPILKLKNIPDVYWGESSETLHKSMLLSLERAAVDVGCAARVSIAPDYKLYWLDDAGTSIREYGY